MMKPILEIRNLSKQYTIGGKKKRYLSLRDSFVDGIKSITKHGKKEQFWALQDINFDVYPGDTIGIIGKNGAGKSTLLKIISRITPPTKGFIKARGRIASLLEVGTGFHPELTGRENIFLNGSILGLKRAEIQYRFDEIVDFSGVEQFLETPLKHYSSGMQLRLAFSVAAHLEPEILVVDEVLAVGDAEFQKKCLGKMEDVSKNEGRTVLFVSHNMGAVEKLCSKALLIQGGQLIAEDHTSEVVKQYLSTVQNDLPMVEFEPVQERLVNILHVAFSNAEKRTTNTFHFSEPITITVKVESQTDLKNLHPVIAINSVQGARVFTVKGFDDDFYCDLKSNTPFTFSATFDDIKLAPGKYNTKVSIRGNNKSNFDAKDHLLSFTVAESPYKNGKTYSKSWGLVKTSPKWRANL